jgi:hypothetical protein
MTKKHKLPNLKILGGTVAVLIIAVVGVRLIFLTHASQLDGDANSDGVVNISDLSILAAHYGIASGTTWSMGDFNGDGAVNINDLAILAAHYGDTLSSLPAVPSGISATATSGSTVSLSWNADSSSGGTVTYLIYRNGTKINTTTSTSYGDSGLTSGDTYSYTIAASNSNGTSNQSSAVDVTPSAGNRPAGLIQAGDSKTVCITNGPNPNNYTEMDFTTLNGITYNCMETFSDAMPVWSNWVSPWITSTTGAPFVAWVQADPTHHSLIDAQNLIPDSEESNPNWTAECAAGDYNTYATQFAQNMVAVGLGYTVIRLAHEMNGTWYNDDLGTTQAQWTQWDECWDQEVTAMRAVSGAHFLFDWNVNSNYRDLPLADIYPGNAYVDIIGIDQYDGSGDSNLPASGTARWNYLENEADGLTTVKAFAAANNKPMSIPEWGTSSAAQPAGGGDDGAYVSGMAGFIASNNVAYQSYFDANDDNILPLDPSLAPLTVAAYIAAFQ